jgi:hypothetical protein
MIKEVSLRYLGVNYGNLIICTWAIDIPEGVRGKEIIDIKKWTDETVDLKPTARAWIKRVNPNKYPPKYKLIISGRGYDDRCTWCRSFRTAMKSHMEKLNCSISQNGSCEFEE